MRLLRFNIFGLSLLALGEWARAGLPCFIGLVIPLTVTLLDLPTIISMEPLTNDCSIEARKTFIASVLDKPIREVSLMQSN